MKWAVSLWKNLCTSDVTWQEKLIFSTFFQLREQEKFFEKIFSSSGRRLQCRLEWVNAWKAYVYKYVSALEFAWACTLTGLFLEFSKLMIASGSWIIETANFEDKEKTCKEIINANIYRFKRDIKNFVKTLILLKKENYKRYTFLHLCCSSLLGRMFMRRCIDE